jgi:hypothetical protein
VDPTDHRAASDGPNRPAPSFIPAPGPLLPSRTRTPQHPRPSSPLRRLLSCPPHHTRETQRARACTSMAGASSCAPRSITTAPLR